MSLEEVAKSVVDKGKRESEEILDEGKKEVQQILAQADHRIKEEMNDQIRLANKEVKKVKARELSAIEMKMLRQKLHSQKEIFDTVKQKAFDSLVNASPQDKDAVLGKLIVKASQVIDSGFIFSNAKDSEVVKQKGARYQYAGTLNCAGGIIVENKDRSIRLDLTYESLFEDVWQDNLLEVAEILFK